MTTIRLGGDKSLNKSELEQWIWGNETAEGPLVGIDCAEGGTVGTFDQDGATPAKPPKIAIDPAPSPGGKAEVCSGRAYVSGVCVKVRVCR